MNNRYSFLPISIIKNKIFCIGVIPKYSNDFWSFPFCKVQCWNTCTIKSHFDLASQVRANNVRGAPSWHPTTLRRRLVSYVSSHLIITVITVATTKLTSTMLTSTFNYRYCRYRVLILYFSTKSHSIQSVHAFIHSWLRHQISDMDQFQNLISVFKTNHILLSDIQITHSHDCCLIASFSPHFLPSILYFTIQTNTDQSLVLPLSNWPFLQFVISRNICRRFFIIIFIFTLTVSSEFDFNGFDQLIELKY